MASHHTKRLMLLRHATASWPLGVDDHDRPLTAQGHREAPQSGRWMVEHRAQPDFILCSSALRTRQTCTWVCQELGEKAPTAKLEEGLYLAPATSMLSLVNSVPETVTSLLVIAHAPGVQNLAMRLASIASDEEPVTELALNYPPAGLTVLEHDCPWAELDLRDAKVTDFFTATDGGRRS